MSLLVIRHTHAGVRGDWPGADHERPLSPRGAAQAEALTELHAARPISRIVTSPYRRCVQTVQPLAARHGLEIEEDDRLAEGASFDLIDGVLRETSGTDDAALCSHGDVIGAILGALRLRDVELGPELTWRKGSTWVIDRWPDTTAATLVPRPDVG